ncbi:MAG: sel1 repeat family protein [Rhizobiales bacterium]|nr:sel1 repeat family protein [Hyphomicrobiales bacterium]
MARMDMSLVDNSQIAAGSNNASSLLELGIMYSTGRDVEQDLVSAHKCFNLAALQGLKEALEYRQEIASEMSPQEIAEAQRQARDWLSMN